MFQYLLNFRLNLYRVVTIETMDSLIVVNSIFSGPPCTGLLEKRYKPNIVKWIEKQFIQGFCKRGLLIFSDSIV